MVAKADTRLKQFQEEFLPRLLRGFHPTLVIAFGSRARGEGLSHSDLDLLIVSESFGSIRWLDRSTEVLEALQLPFGTDLLCYTPAEYERKREELGIVRTATEQGIVLHRADRTPEKSSFRGK
jgi:uncharacterized protein